MLVGCAFVSEVLGTLSGFGSSTFFVPVAALLEDFKFVLALTAILHCFGNISKIMLFRGGFDRRQFLRLALPSILATAVGAWFTKELSSAWALKGLGVLMIAFSILTFILGSHRLRLPPAAGAWLTGLSGFCTGFLGTGGAIRGMALTSMAVPKTSFIALSASIDIGGDLTRLIIYLGNGYMNWDHWYYIPSLGVSAYLGALVGRRILTPISQHRFEQIVAFFILLSGIALLF